MNLIGMFKKPQNELEKGGRVAVQPPAAAQTDSAKRCNECKSVTELGDLGENLYVCPKCGYHFRMNARQRLAYIADGGSFSEMFGDIVSRDVIQFPGYEGKLVHAKLASGENEAVICGTCTIEKNPCGVFILAPQFMMGSMSTAVGEKIASLFEYATAQRLPVVGYTASGGARMQEGILALMQMAKTSGAVKRHSDAGLLYIVVLTDPTTGGVTASFAMQGDIILAEPRATVGFAGARVIEQTTGSTLPQGFQKAEFVQQHGFIDAIVPRRAQRAMISQILSMHSENKNYDISI